MAKTFKNEDGFASIQFIFLMGFTIILLTGFLNILFIEYNRNSALTSLREAARSGTRITDLQAAVANPDKTNLNLAISECKTRGEESLKDLMKSDGLSVTCNVISLTGEPAEMEAVLVGIPDVALVPWVQPIANLRLSDLSKSYVQRQAAQ